MSKDTSTDASATKQDDVQLIINVQVDDDGTAASDTIVRSVAEQLNSDDRLSVEHHLYHYNYTLDIFNIAGNNINQTFVVAKKAHCAVAFTTNWLIFSLEIFKSNFKQTCMHS
jgi:hypothetical protein